MTAIPSKQMTRYTWKAKDKHLLVTERAALEYLKAKSQCKADNHKSTEFDFPDSESEFDLDEVLEIDYEAEPSIAPCVVPKRRPKPQKSWVSLQNRGASIAKHGLSLLLSSENRISTHTSHRCMNCRHTRSRS